MREFTEEEKAKAEENLQTSKKEVARMMRDDYWLGEDIGIFAHLGPRLFYPLFSVDLPENQDDYTPEHIINILYMEVMKNADKAHQSLKKANDEYGRGSREHKKEVAIYQCAIRSTDWMRMKVIEFIQSGIFSSKDFVDKHVFQDGEAEG